MPRPEAEVGAREVVARRRDEREALMERGRRFVRGLDTDLGVRAAVIVGSVPRGDFNLWSDVDVVVVADGLGPTLLERLEQLGSRPGRVEPFA